jgi:hypothetical protein
MHVFNRVILPPTSAGLNVKILSPRANDQLGFTFDVGGTANRRYVTSVTVSGTYVDGGGVTGNITPVTASVDSTGVWDTTVSVPVTAVSGTIVASAAGSAPDTVTPVTFTATPAIIGGTVVDSGFGTDGVAAALPIEFDVTYKKWKEGSSDTIQADYIAGWNTTTPIFPPYTSENVSALRGLILNYAGPGIYVAQFAFNNGAGATAQATFLKRVP